LEGETKVLRRGFFDVQNRVGVGRDEDDYHLKTPISSPTPVKHDRLITAIVLGLMLTAAGTSARADVPAAVSGKVFLDANGNGALDAGEKPLPGVCVTDGVQLVTTGDGGTYQLKIAADPLIPYKPAQVVSVCWPSGKWPVGKWWRRLSDVADAAAVDFALRNEEQTLPFAFGHLSDDHGAMVSAADKYAATLKPMARRLKFLFNTGDTATHKGADGHMTFKPLADAQAKWAVPCFDVPGNHDMANLHTDAWKDQSDHAGWGPWTKHMGPLRWSFSYAGVHFAAVDFMRGKDMGVPGVALKWLDADLKAQPKGTRTILLVHYPSGVDRAVSKHRIAYVLAGHTHSGQYADVGGVLCFQTPPSGLTVTTVTTDALYVAEQDMPWASRYWYAHSGHRYFNRGVGPAIQRRRGKQHSLADKALKNQTHTIQAGKAESVEIGLHLQPGTTGRSGVRIGKDKQLELAFADGAIQIDGALMPLTVPMGRTVHCRILADTDRVTVTLQQAPAGRNSVQTFFRLPIERPIHSPSTVTAFAGGGPATTVKLDVWELAPLIDARARSLCHFPPQRLVLGPGGSLQGHVRPAR